MSLCLKPFFCLLVRYHVAHHPYRLAVKIALTAVSAYGPTAKATLIITDGSYDENTVKALLTTNSIGNYFLRALEQAVK